MAAATGSFVQRSGCRFMLDGKPFYFNGWNSYWLMARSVDAATRTNVQDILKQASDLGMTVCRTWAFNDAGYQALQVSPGHYDEKVFQALDYVLDQAKKHGIRLILSFVNNWDDYGGKAQYCKWAREAGVQLDDNTSDAFFSNPTIKGYFKAHIKAVVTRVNTISNIAYSEDPTVFSWELINEPRCLADKSGNLLQDWIEEMGAYVKSLDTNHLLTVGLEGFFGKSSSTASLDANPQDWCQWLGCDYLRNHALLHIDFATVHAYLDSWRSDLPYDGILEYLQKWVSVHAKDTERYLGMPLVIAEFGLLDKFGSQCQLQMFKSLFDVAFESAVTNGALAGTMIWQLLPQGMEGFQDGYALVPSTDPLLSKLLKLHSTRLHQAMLFNGAVYHLDRLFLVEEQVEEEQQAGFQLPGVTKVLQRLRNGTSKLKAWKA